MAEVALSFVIQNLAEIIRSELDQHTKGEEIIQWIQKEVEKLLPELERAEEDRAGSSEINDLKDVIGKADVLTETFAKRVFQRKRVELKNPIYTITEWRFTKRLRQIKDEFARARDQFRERAQVYRPDDTPAERNLPSYLIRCIHFLNIFPPSFEIPARRLIVLWVAEGLALTNKHDNESAEQIAERYLSELVDLKVIVAVTKKRSGKVKTWAIDVGRRDQLLGRVDYSQRKIRRLVDSNGSSSESFIKIHGNPTISHSVSRYRDVFSFLSFNTQEGSKPGADIGEFLRKCISAGCFQWLMLLDLERVFRPDLPHSLGRLIGLKYLGLRWTYLEQLPDSVHRLLNLHVLDVKHTYISVLPRSIWRMQYLRHLYLSEAYRTRFPVPPSRVTLTALQSLWGAFVDEDTCVIRGLDRLLDIRKLGLSCKTKASKPDGMSTQLNAINKWISKLEFLESLRLKSRDESGKAADLLLTSLEGNKKLSTLYLLGKLDSRILCALPLSLTDITLSGSELDLDPMPFLGRMPHLVILRLLGQSVVCTNMYCSRRDFHRLKALFIWKLENLEEFEVEEGSFPCLQELEIRSCHRLGNLSNRLQHVQNLEIKLTNDVFEEEASEEHQSTLKQTEATAEPSTTEVVFEPAATEPIPEVVPTNTKPPVPSPQRFPPTATLNAAPSALSTEPISSKRALAVDDVFSPDQSFRIKRLNEMVHKSDDRLYKLTKDCEELAGIVRSLHLCYSTFVDDFQKGEDARKEAEAAELKKIEEENKRKELDKENEEKKNKEKEELTKKEKEAQKKADKGKAPMTAEELEKDMQEEKRKKKWRGPEKVKTDKERKKITLQEPTDN